MRVGDGLEGVVEECGRIVEGCGNVVDILNSKKFVEADKCCCDGLRIADEEGCCCCNSFGIVDRKVGAGVLVVERKDSMDCLDCLG